MIAEVVMKDDDDASDLRVYIVMNVMTGTADINTQATQG